MLLRLPEEVVPNRTNYECRRRHSGPHLLWVDSRAAPTKAPHPPGGTAPYLGDLPRRVQGVNVRLCDPLPVQFATGKW